MSQQYTGIVRRRPLVLDWIADSNQALLFQPVPMPLSAAFTYDLRWRAAPRQDYIQDTNQALYQIVPMPVVTAFTYDLRWRTLPRQDYIQDTNQALLLPPIVAAPFAQLDWPNPAQPRWPVSLYSFFGGRISAPVIAGPQPFAQYDWPNSQRRLASLQDWIADTNQALLFPPVVAGTPFAQTDWPNPRAPFNIASYQSFIDHISIELIPPEGTQKDWPNPRRPQYSIALYTWTSGVAPAPVVVAATPFAQSDWPVPRGARWPVSLYTGAGGRVSAAPIIVNPFAQTDWPNPQAPRRSIDLYGWLQAQTALVLPAPVISPFAQTDWPNPRGARRPIDLYGWVCALSSLNLPAPPVPAIAQYDWPNPRGAQRSIDLYGWIQALSALNLPAPIAPPPTNYDWPNPRAPQRGISLGTSNPNRVYVPPAVVPPPVGPSVGGGAGFVHFFSRRRWREFMEAYEAEVRAIMDLRGSRPVPQQEAIEAAITATNRAILYAREAAENAKLNADLVRLANNLDAAVGAKKVAYSIKRANAAIAASERIIIETKRQAEEDEEDMITILLMLH